VDPDLTFHFYVHPDPTQIFTHVGKSENSFLLFIHSSATLSFMATADAVHKRNKSLHSVIFPSDSGQELPLAGCRWRRYFTVLSDDAQL
jgi:hypothetical protein